MPTKRDPYKKCEKCGATMVGILKCSGDRAPRKECIKCEKKDAAVA